MEWAVWILQLLILLTYFIWFISLTTKTYFLLVQEFPKGIMEKIVDANLLISTFTSAERKIIKSPGTGQKQLSLK